MFWDNLISRGLWLVAQPSNMVVFILLGGLFLLWRGQKRWGMSLLLGLGVFYLLTAFGLTQSCLMVPLEQRFYRYNNVITQGPYSGIIVLGGAERAAYSSHHNQVVLSGAAERLIAAAKLARLFPTLPVIFSGGIRYKNQLSEADIARRFFLESGIDESRLRLEDKSWNTNSNARETKKHIRENETDRWFLVTSAFHMPRAVGAYRKQDIAIQPYPVDYRTDLTFFRLHKPDVGHYLADLDNALHEWLGLLVYRLRGWTDHLYPAPA